MTASTSLVPVLFLLIAYIGLRWKKKQCREVSALVIEPLA